MTLYTVMPERHTLHGHFSRDLPPILTIEPGDTVRFRTLDAGWNLEPRRSTVYAEGPARFEPLDPLRDAGHALCGPIAIRGAEPGMTLVATVGEVRPGAWGHTAIGGWPHPINEHFGLIDEGTYLLWTLDAETMTGHNQLGRAITLHPFMGVMGMPPAEPGMHSTIPPRVTGGNIDCKELVAGSTLYLPIAVSGGLFSVGDGHAAQGDGEACVTAIECPVERVDITFHLESEMRLTAPRANTPAGWLTFGFHEDLNQATMLALGSMLDLMSELYGMSGHEALGMASVVVDLRITQIVNEVRGVHALLPHGAIR
jgi:acetamidase/formamidase